MKLLKSIAIAFTTYSRIPMPIFEWKEEDMRYSMCFFPWVGGRDRRAGVAVVSTGGGAWNQYPDLCFDRCRHPVACDGRNPRGWIHGYDGCISLLPIAG